MKQALILSAAIALASFSSAAASKDAFKPTVEVLLNKQSADKIHIGALTPSLVVTPTHILMIEDINGSIRPHGAECVPSTDFAGSARSIIYLTAASLE